MSYTKTTTPVLDLHATVAAVLREHAITDPVQDTLVAAGSTVLLDTGALVWVSSVVHDRPQTPQIDCLTVAIACTPDGTPQTKANGQHVATAFWHSLWPASLAALGMATVRKALCMIALGEPQPQVDIPNPVPDGPTQADALPIANPQFHSIRTQIQVANHLAAPIDDVL